MYAIRMVKHLLNQSSLLLLYNSILYCFNERIKAWDKERELSLSLVGKKDLKTHQKSWFNAAKLTQQYQFLNAVKSCFKPWKDMSCTVCIVGWRDFRKKILGTCHVVVDCSGTPNLKFYLDLLLFHLAQGLTSLRKPLKSLKSPKMSTQQKFLKTKNEEKLFKKCFTIF